MENWKEYYNYKVKLLFEGEYLEGKKWNGKGYDTIGENIYNLKNGKSKKQLSISNKE